MPHPDLDGRPIYCGSPGRRDDPGLVAGDVALDPRGPIGGEVVRKAADDDYGGGSIPGREAADSEYVIHRVSTRRRASLTSSGR
jgi:hypothetical protein